MTHNDPLLKWRSEFPILEKTTYLVSNSLGAMPRGVYDLLQRYADSWVSYGVQAWNKEWWDLNIDVGNQVGAIIGAPPNTISMHQNVSLVMGILMTCFDYNGPRNKVVIEEGIFPSVYYVLRGMLPPHIELHMVSGEDGGKTVPTDRLVDAIDERTIFASISHVLFRSAYIVDVKAVAEKARKTGAQLIVDGYHAPGIIPVDVSDIGTDFYVGGVLKWLCGGPGGVFLYAREDHLKTIQPGLTGWIAHQRPFNFEVDDIELREDAFRLLNGTPSIAPLYATQPGLEIIGKVGVDRIREKSKRQTALIIDRAKAAGYALNTIEDPTKRGGTVIVNPPHAFEVSQELLARDIIIDFRPNAGIRISPHFYNTDEEIHLAMDAIDDILDSAAWKAHASKQPIIT